MVDSIRGFVLDNQLILEVAQAWVRAQVYPIAKHELMTTRSVTADI